MTRIAAALLILGALFSGCRDKDPKPTGEDFDKEAMLTHIGAEVIVPAYALLCTELETLRGSVSTFESARTEANLSALREQFKKAYTQWERCSVFEFGPAENRNLRLTFNTFPTDTSRVLENVSSGNADLGSAQNSLAVGLPAMDFLLYARSTTSDALPLFEGESNARLDYLKRLAVHLDEQSDAVHQDWLPAGGNYIATFRTSTSSAAGSAISLLVNQINFEFELIKNARVGIPLGKKTLGVAQPEKVEAPYSNNSLDLAIANLDAVQLAYSGGTGTGLDDQLDALGAKHGSVNLSTAINSGFETVRNALMAIPPPLQSAIGDDPTSVNAAYDAFMQLLVLLKTDMPSQLGIQITYQDNDGD